MLQEQDIDDPLTVNYSKDNNAPSGPYLVSPQNEPSLGSIGKGLTPKQG